MSAFVILSAAAAFDPEAATQAYLATLKGAARAKSDAYFEGGYWLILWNAVVGLAVLWLALRTGWSAAWSRWAERVSKWKALRPALYALPFTLITYAISFPFTIYTDYFREKQYGLLNQDFGAWIGERATDLAVDVVVTMLLFMAIYAVIRRAPKRWWLFGAVTMTVFYAIGAAVAPVLIAPLFNKYTELPGGPVRDRIMAMAKANNVPAEHVYLFDASKQTDRISANVSGLGPTIRISINDNLLKRGDLPEIASVMGHELGHYVLGHVWKSILAFGALFVLAFWLMKVFAERLIARHGAKWGVASVADPASAPALFAILTVFFVILTPVTNTLIRVNESEADAFGLNAAREPDGFARIAMKLSQYRKIEPGPVEEFLFFDHPSGRTRIRMAMDWKAAHMPK